MIQKLQDSNQILSIQNKQLTGETLSYKEEIKKMVGQVNQLQNLITTQNRNLLNIRLCNRNSKPSKYKRKTKR